MRSYMELDPEGFEKITQITQNEEKNKSQKVKDNENKWAKLEGKYGTQQ